jgi:coenzyme F420-reducing hydrogenase delta subunit
VLVVGCQPGECHYQKGNLLQRRRALEAEPLLRALGIGSERLRLEWMSTSERNEIEGTVRVFTQAIEQLGPNPLNGGGR